MKSVIKAFVLLIVMLVVVVVAGAYIIPPTAHVERAVVIKAQPEMVYAVIGDLRQFNEWSPWYGLDPKASYSVEGAAGTGQRLVWSSADPRVGNGSQTVVEAEIDRKLATDIDFGDMGKARSTLSLVPVPEGTAVVWSFDAATEGIMERWMSLFFDRWIGADYEKGLARLKEVVERNGS